jgi:hypothetical protein
MKPEQTYSVSVDPHTFQMTIRRLIWPSAANRGKQSPSHGKTLPACFVPVEAPNDDVLDRFEADAEYERDKREAFGFGFTFGEDIILTEAEATEIRAGKTPARIQALSNPNFAA